MKDRSKKDIEAFLADLGKRPGIADWQVRQAEHVLRILYEIFLPHDAPEKHIALSKTGKNYTREAVAKTDRFRDRVIPGEMERRFSQLIEAVKPLAAGSPHGKPQGLALRKTKNSSFLRKTMMKPAPGNHTGLPLQRTNPA